MRAAIILAAGQGRRFGSNKMLSPHKDRPLVTHALDAACSAPVDHIIAVTGHEAEKVALVLSDYAAKPVTIVVAGDFADGMAASLRAGIKALPGDTEAVAIFLGDMPDVPHDLVRQLFEAVEQGAPAAAPVRGEKRGHPVVFAQSLFPRLLALSGDTGARALFAEVGDRWARVPCSDDGIFLDIDRPRENSRLLE